MAAQDSLRYARLLVLSMGATNTLERMAASIGQLNAVEPSFVASVDVPNAGVLFNFVYVLPLIIRLMPWMVSHFS